MSTIKPGGWPHSGDVGRIDGDGYVHLHASVKDVIITGGENVCDPEVESVHTAYPGVSGAVVVGGPDERWGETVKAFVVPRPGTTPSEAEIVDVCHSRLAHFQCPMSEEFAAALPPQRHREGAQAGAARPVPARARERRI